MSGRHVPLVDCDRCGEPVRFVKLDTGKNIPINPGTNPGGRVAAMKVGSRLHGFVISRDRYPSAGMSRFTPHAATCTDRPPAPPKPDPAPALFDGMDL